MVSVMINHFVIIVNIGISLYVFVIAPDLSESINLESSMNFEDW